MRLVLFRSACTSTSQGIVAREVVPRRNHHLLDPEGVTPAWYVLPFDLALPNLSQCGTCMLRIRFAAQQWVHTHLFSRMRSRMQLHSLGISPHPSSCNNVREP